MTKVRKLHGVSSHLAENIEKVATVMAEAEKRVGRHQRAIERVTQGLGRPSTIYAIVAFVVVWLLYNGLAKGAGLRPFDPPPFSFLQGLLALAALLMSTMILATQNRHTRAAEQHASLDLQVNLLAERKVTKLISLLEELRHDLPSVRDRVDRTAESMAATVDPVQVIEAIEERLSNPSGTDDPPPPPPK